MEVLFVVLAMLCLRVIDKKATENLSVIVRTGL